MPLHPQEPDADDDASAQRNLLVLVFITVLVSLSIWLVTQCQENNRRIECLEAGHHDCVPLDSNARGT